MFSNRVLIIGITGFAGSYLYKHLSNNRDYDIYGTFYQNDKKADGFNKVELYQCDINDVDSIEHVLKQCKPEYIFHLAACVNVHKSFINPMPIFQTNVMGTVNVLEAIRKTNPNCRILLTGSAEEYGKISHKMMPIKETYTLNPISPYGLSKKMQEELGILYHKTYGLNIVISRTFHYSGPHQPLGFVFSDFAKQIVDVKNNKQDYIKVGNLDAKRDFTDIRDVVSAYVALMEYGKIGEVYNVCSGHSVSIKDILDMMISDSEVDIEVVLDENKLRPSDIPDFVGNNNKLKKDTGWKQQFSIKETVNDVLNSWIT